MKLLNKLVLLKMKIKKYVSIILFHFSVIVECTHRFYNLNLFQKELRSVATDVVLSTKHLHEESLAMIRNAGNVSNFYY